MIGEFVYSLSLPLFPSPSSERLRIMPIVRACPFLRQRSGWGHHLDMYDYYFLSFKALHGQKLMYMYVMLRAIMADSDQL